MIYCKIDSVLEHLNVMKKLFEKKKKTLTKQISIVFLTRKNFIEIKIVLLQ